MKRIESHEFKLIGEWNLVEGKVIGNYVCERIMQLTDNYLQKLATDSSGWDVLFKDPNDGRYWELIYPQSYMHGGGPPTLECIPEYVAFQKYYYNKQ